MSHPVGRMPLADFLRSRSACDEAVAWAEPYGLEYERAWQECQRGDWMIWILCKTNCPDAVLRLIACDCARAVLHLYEDAYPGDTRPRRAIEAGEALAAWAAARDAPGAAAWDAAGAAAGAAAWAAAGAAAWAAAWAAAGAAAWAAARAAAGAAAGDAAGAARDAARDAAWDAGAAAWDAGAAQADIARRRTAGYTLGLRP